jgi:hypothetical protein
MKKADKIKKNMKVINKLNDVLSRLWITTIKINKEKKKRRVKENRFKHII